MTGRPRSARWMRWRRPALLGSVGWCAPFSDRYGFDRGTPIDRYYIEQFITRHRADVRGRVLEVKDSNYTRRFGANVLRSDVLDVDAANPLATVQGDLASGLPHHTGAFDCCIVTQVLQYVFDVRAAVRTLRSVLAPGGVLLLTVPGLTRHAGSGEPAERWLFTEAGCRQIFELGWDAEDVDVRIFGNVVAAVGFLTGMAREEIPAADLDRADPRYPVLIALRAVRAA